jgi:hypothetical protein
MRMFFCPFDSLDTNKSRGIKDLAFTDKSAYLRTASQYQFRYHTHPKRPLIQTPERIRYQLDQEVTRKKSNRNEDIQLASLPLPLRDTVITTLQHHDELLKKPPSPISPTMDTYFQSSLSLDSQPMPRPILKTPPQKYSVIQPHVFVPIHRKTETLLIHLRQGNVSLAQQD